VGQQVNVVDVVEKVVFLEESERLIPHTNEAIHPFDPLDPAAEQRCIMTLPMSCATALTTSYPPAAEPV